MTAERESLYDRLGGKDSITTMIDDWVGNVEGDGRINAFFAKTNVPRFKMMLADQICAAAGGPCVYTGDDMRAVHRGMHITDAQFNAMVDDLVQSLEKMSVPAREREDLLAMLRQMEPDIVGQ